MDEYNHQTESDEISLKDLILKGKEIWQLLLKKWVIIFLAGFIGASLGVTKAWLTDPLYIAKLTFSIENDKSNPLGAYSGLAAMAGIDVGGTSGSMFSSDNILSIMTSRKMIVNTLLSPISVNNNKTTLIEYWLSFNHINDKWNQDPKFAGLKFPLKLKADSLSRQQDSLLTNIHSSLIKSVISIEKSDKKLSIIDATCISKNEIFSKAFLETLNTQVAEFYIGIKTKRQKDNVNILQSKADSLSSVLSNLSFRSASLADQNLNMSKQVGNVDRQRKQIDIQVASTAYTEIIKNLEVAKITLLKETPLIQVIDQPVLPLLKEKASRLKGLLIGGILGSLLIVAFLIGQKYFRKMMNEENKVNG